MQISKVDPLDTFRSDVRLVETVVSTERATEVRSRLITWARENAFTDLTFGRRSAAIDVASITAAQLGTGGLGSVVQVEELVKDLSQRLSMRRWPTLLPSMIPPSVSPTSPTTRPSSSPVSREFVLAQIEQELTRLLEDIDRQRVETIGVLQSEIGTAEDSLSKELDDALQALKQEREALIAELEDYSERTFDRASQESKELLDYLFWRVMQLVLLVAVVVVLVMFFSRYVLRSKRNQA